MKIGELAKQVGVTVETIRYYENEGLLHPARRNPTNNYRRYDQGHLERLIFIRRCRKLAMAHSEIKVLLQARIQPDASCETINELIDEHIHHVQARMAELKILETQLIELRSQCHAALTTRDCGILRELDHPIDELSEVSSAKSHVAGSQCKTFKAK